MENISFSELSKQVSDVTVGIGSDGVIFIGPSDRADFRMRVFDHNGLEVENCGKGINCTAKYLYDTMYAESTTFTLDTLGGDVKVKVEVGERRRVKNVMVWDDQQQVWTKDEVHYVCYGELEKF